MVLEIFNTLHRCVGKVEDGAIIDANGDKLGYIDYAAMRFYDSEDNLLVLLHKGSLFTKQGRRLCVFYENTVKDKMSGVFLNVVDDKIMDNKNYVKGYVKGEIPVRKSIVLAALFLAYTIDLF